MRPYFDPHDHAFANGPVFPRPASLADARAAFEYPEDGERLWALFELFDRRAEVGEGLRLGLNARLVAPEEDERRVRVGRDCAIRGILRCDGRGRITLGERVYVGDDVILSAMNHVEIGAGTMLAHGTQVFDNDTHPVDADEREAHFKAILRIGPAVDPKIATSPVRIGRRCWIGFGGTVMKGVAIGDEAIVGAGAVVVTDVPAGAMAAGNPARVVKRP